MKPAELQKLSTHSSAALCTACKSLQVETLHMDQDSANNAPDDLVYLCRTHHWM